MTTVVKVTRQDARLVLTIDRPEDLNALNAEVIGAPREALHRTRSDDTPGWARSATSAATAPT